MIPLWICPVLTTAGTKAQCYRQVVYSFVAPLLILALFMCETFAAEYPCSNSFMISGEMTSQIGTIASNNNPSSQFVVALTADKILVGWSYGDLSPIESNAKLQCRQTFRFSDLNLSHTISLQVSATNGPDILQSSDRTLTSLVRQEPLGQATLTGLVLNAVAGPFNDCPLLFFAQDPTRELSQSQICELVQSGEGTVRNEYCEVRLLAPDSSGHQSFSLLQSSDDLLCVHPKLKLLDAKSSRYPTGLEAIRITCEFDRRAQDLGKAPWKALTLNESLGKNGQSTISKRNVSVTNVVTDPQAIHESMMQVLQLIPDGQPIITDEKVQYQWKNGRIETQQQASESGNAGAELLGDAIADRTTGETPPGNSAISPYLAIVVVTCAAVVAVLMYCLVIKLRTA